MRVGRQQHHSLASPQHEKHRVAGDLPDVGVVVSVLAGLARVVRVDEGRENLATLGIAIEQHRHEEGERAAHTLKSSSKALGLLALSESMASIEGQFAGGKVPQVESLKYSNAVFEEGLALLTEHLSLA